MLDLRKANTFIFAQDPVYPNVLSELANGVKKTHWMWFVFPQIDGLSTSEMGMRYAIDSLAEAREYAEDLVLGRRLVVCTHIVNNVCEDEGILRHCFGEVDTQKFWACMTLFRIADPHEPEFQLALNVFFSGDLHVPTLERL